MLNPQIHFNKIKKSTLYKAHSLITMELNKNV